MIYENFLKDLLESVTEYRKIVLLMVLIKVEKKDYQKKLVLVNVILIVFV